MLPSIFDRGEFRTSRLCCSLSHLAKHADNLNQMLVKEKEFLSCCQVFSIEENLEPAVMLQFITPCCSYRDDKEYRRKTNEIIVLKT